MFARSVLVTGGNRGIGLGLVKELVVTGKTHHLFVGCRMPYQADELHVIADEHKHVVLLELDVTKSETITKAVDKISATVGSSGLNCLINNAGVVDKFTTIEGVTTESLMHLFQTNAIGPAMLTKACLPLLQQASSLVTNDYMAVSHAGVINISSILGSIQQNDIGRNYGYRMSKTALNILTKNLSVELKCDKILCVSIHPGWVRTDLGGTKAPLSIEKSVKGILSVVSMLREGETGSFYGYDGNKIPW